MSNEHPGISRRAVVVAIGTAPLLACTSTPPNGETNTSPAPGSSGGSAGDTGTGTVTGTDHPGSGNKEDSVDVVVIGAGLSGLVAARRLRGKGYSVRVLEACDRVGGRVMDRPLRPGVVAEGGAQWVSPSQTAVLDLARELGVLTFPATVPGKTRFHFEGFMFDQETQDDTQEVKSLRAQLDALASTVPVDTPWLAPNAKELDSKTVGQWLSEKNASSESIQTFTLSVATILGDINQISLLYFAFYIASAGGMQKLETDAQSLRLVGGPAQLAEKMAKELADNIWTSSPVTSVVQNESSIVVYTPQGSIKANRLILALNPVEARKIDFNPPLPPPRKQLQELWAMNPGTKLHLVYEQPFWRDLGLSGTLVTDFPVLAFAVDASPPDASLGVLAVFPNDASLPQSKAGREMTLVAEIQKLFGQDTPPHINYVETLWGEQPWISGCTSVVAPGVLTQAGATLRDRFGRVHWAGTESATVWCGYMDGAVRAGTRAAGEVAGLLNRNLGHRYPK